MTHLYHIFLCIIIFNERNIFKQICAGDTSAEKVSHFMYTKHTNPLAITSQNMITEGLFELMEKKNFESITVTELCDCAKVGRKTFYRNFETKEDVIEFRLDSLYSRFSRDIGGKEPEERLRVYLEFIRNHSSLFITLYQNGLHNLTMEKFRTIMPETMTVFSSDDTAQQYISRYVTAGVEETVRVWAERNFAESVDDIIRIVKAAQNIQNKI